MKNITLSILVCCISYFGYSQTVTIPDNEFKQALLNYSPRIDTNYNNQIEVSEAQAVTSLTITNHQYMMMPGWDPINMIMTPGIVAYGISDFTGIEAFTNLTYLNCSSNDLSSLNVSALTQLTYLDCSSNTNYNGAPYSTGISTLTLPTTTTLTTLKCASNKIAGSLNLSSFSNITTLDLGANQITTLTLPNTNTLQSLKLNNNQVTSLNIVPYTALTSLNCSYNQLTALDISTNTLLTSLICNNNQLPSLNVLQNPLLATIECQSNLITSLDVTQQTTALTRLKCNNNNLSSLKMKNGNNTALTNFNFDARNNANLTLICVDNITYASANFNNINSQMYFASICSFIPSGTNTIKGTITYDFDVNGCDPADVKSINTKIATVSNNVSSLTFTNSNGAYTLYTPDASSVTAITPNFPSFFSVSPSSQTSTFTGLGNTDTVNYCITANTLVEDVSISILPTFEARPGFQTSVRIFYKNNGSAIVSGNFSFTYEANKQTLNSTSVSPATQVGNLLTWNYTNLLPFESRYVDVFLTTNTPVDPINPVNNGDLLHYTGNITTTTGDSDSTNNTSIVNDLTIGSHDPNDSIFLEGEQISAQAATAFLHVRIRFQNTGTASAINIKVETLLDADLDWDTFEPMTASHNFTTTLSNSNKVEFFFENIYLPDSTSDEPGSNGWVYFKIKAKSSFAIGDIADNSASIFFDYNAPVITNTATTQINSTLSNNKYEAVKFNIYPNPASVKVTVSLQTKATFSLLSVNGQVVKQGQLQVGENTLNISNISNGLYFLQVKTLKGISTKKIVKQ